MLSWLFSLFILVCFILFYFPPPSAVTEAASPPPPRDLLRTASARGVENKRSASPAGPVPGQPPGSAAGAAPAGTGRAGDGGAVPASPRSGERDRAAESFLPLPQQGSGGGSCPSQGGLVICKFFLCSLQPLSSATLRPNRALLLRFPPLRSCLAAKGIIKTCDLFPALYMCWFIFYFFFCLNLIFFKVGSAPPLGWAGPGWAQLRALFPSRILSSRGRRAGCACVSRCVSVCARGGGAPASVCPCSTLCQPGRHMTAAPAPRHCGSPRGHCTGRAAGGWRLPGAGAALAESLNPRILAHRDTPVWGNQGVKASSPGKHHNSGCLWVPHIFVLSSTSTTPLTSAGGMGEAGLMGVQMQTGLFLCPLCVQDQP